jgi:seryl-tRNA synthetase
MRSLLWKSPRPCLRRRLFPLSGHLSTIILPPLPPSFAESPSATVEKVTRLSSKNILFDVNLFTHTPEIIRSHLLSRREDEAMVIESIEEINQLQKVRVENIRSGNQMKQERKQLSQLIGQHMKRKGAAPAGTTEEEDQESKRIEQLRKSVELLKGRILESDKAIDELEVSIETLMLKIPNLLDDR